jgi:hypothetical protein
VLFTVQVQPRGDRAAVQVAGNRQNAGEGQAGPQTPSQAAPVGRWGEWQVNISEADEDHPRDQVRERTRDGVPADHLPERDQGDARLGGRQRQTGDPVGRPLERRPRQRNASVQRAGARLQDLHPVLSPAGQALEGQRHPEGLRPEERIPTERFGGILFEQPGAGVAPRLHPQPQRHPPLPQGHERDHRVRDSHKQYSVLVRRRRRAKVAKTKVVSVLRLGDVDTVPRLLVGVRPGAAGGPKDEQAGGVEGHLRHDSQQPDIRERVGHPLPEQVRLAAEEGGQSGDQHPLVLPTVRGESALDQRREGVHLGDVHRREEGVAEGVVSPFHDGRRHREHQSRLRVREGDHSAPESGEFAALTTVECICCRLCTTQSLQD